MPREYESEMNATGSGYKPERDGDLEEYFSTYDGRSSFPLFKGSEQFEMLYREGYIRPYFTTLRVMWNMDGGDEHFSIVDGETIEGIDLRFHGGREGKHSIKILDECPSYEIHHPFIKRLRR